MKQAIVLRTDLGMGKGKLVAQGSHASLQAYKLALKKDEKIVKAWEKEGSKKIILKVSSEKELLGVYEKAKKASLPASLIVDAGFTQLTPGTITAVAIGPWKEKEVNEITGELKLL